MIEMFKTLMDAFKPVFDAKLSNFYFKRLLLTFIPFSLALFVASRFSSIPIKWLIISASLMWVYAILIISAGLICRRIYTSDLRDENIDFKTCIAFSWEYGPAYMFIPVVALIAGLTLQIASFLIFYSTLIPFAGDILMGIVLVPIILLNTAFIVLSAIIVYLTPAIIGYEDRGITFVFNRILTLAWQLKSRLLIFFLMASVIITTLTLSFMLLASVTISSTVSLTLFVLDTKAEGLYIFALGNLLPGFERFQGDIPFSYYIFSILLYISGAFLAALIFTIPGLYTCSSSTLFYDLLCRKELEYQRIQKEEDEQKA